MGKTTSMWGKTTGKVGGLVYATAGGEQIVREYNPNVANPSTQAQVDQRAKLKLMSQLSAALSPVLAMTKDGLISKRNKFTKINFPASYALNGIAQITYENVQITEGSAGLPQVVVNAVFPASGDPAAYLATAPGANISRVVYCVFRKSQENRIEFLISKIISQRTEEGVKNAYFICPLTELPVSNSEGETVFDGEYVIYAYGMIDTSERATARYGNLNVQSASDIATLVANRTISYEDFQFTQTRGTTVGHGTAGDNPTPAGQARVFVTALGNGGSVTGGGTFAVGSPVTVSATAASGYRFVRWVKNGTSQTVSTNNPYTFNVQEQTDLVAVFELSGSNDSL